MNTIIISSLVLLFAENIYAASLPIKISSATILGNETSNNYPGVNRDGGWESKIGSTYFQFYADTETCDAKAAGRNCHGFAANTLAQATTNPQIMHDLPPPDANGNPSTLCAGANGYRLHLTNIASLSNTQGAAWYTNISSDTSQNIDGAAVGGGVAVVTWNGGSSTPTCQVTPQFWDGSKEPIFGSAGVFAGGPDGYIYLLGGLGTGAPGAGDNDLWAARVGSGSQNNLAAYQYWNGTAWQGQRLIYPDYNGYAPASVIQNVGQGSLFYSAYYNVFVYVFPIASSYLPTQIGAKTSSSIQGPWSDTTVIYDSKGAYGLYAPVAQPHYDTSGKTLIIKFANFSPIYLLALKITFQ